MHRKRTEQQDAGHQCFCYMLEAMVVYTKIISEIFAREKTSTYLLSINRTLDISFPRIQPRLSRGVDRRCYLKEKRLLDDCTLRHQYAEHLQVIHIYESSDMCLLQPRPIRMPIAARYSGPRNDHGLIRDHGHERNCTKSLQAPGDGW